MNEIISIIQDYKIELDQSKKHDRMIVQLLLYNYITEKIKKKYNFQYISHSKILLGCILKFNKIKKKYYKNCNYKTMFVIFNFSKDFQIDLIGQYDIEGEAITKMDKKRIVFSNSFLKLSIDSLDSRLRTGNIANNKVEVTKIQSSTMR